MKPVVPIARYALIAALLVLCGCNESTAPPVAHPQDDLIVRGLTQKPFADVILELEFAITERNFRITGRNTIGKGLRARGYKDFPNVEVIHFCNLEYAREVLLIDPGYVAMMPCRITVHETRDSKTAISLILLPNDHRDRKVNAFADRMNQTLREILAFVLEEEQ